MDWKFGSLICILVSFAANNAADVSKAVEAQESFYEDDTEIPIFRQRQTNLQQHLLSPIEQDEGGQLVKSAGPDRLAKSGKTSWLGPYGGDNRGGRGKRRFICPPPPKASPVTVKVTNWAHVPAQLFWIIDEGSRQNMGDPFDPNESREIKTYPGRVYKAYAAIGQLMIQYKCEWKVSSTEIFTDIFITA